MDANQRQAEDIQQRVNEQFKDWRDLPSGVLFFKLIEAMIAKEEKVRVTNTESPGATAMATARKEGYIQALEDVLAIRL